MSLKDLAAQAGCWPRARTLSGQLLPRLRLIEQDTVSGRYALGAAALQLGLACLHQLDQCAPRWWPRSWRSTGHAVALAVWGKFRADGRG